MINLSTAQTISRAITLYSVFNQHQNQAIPYELLTQEQKRGWEAVAEFMVNDRMDWQPIETAPKDKTPVMVCDKNHDYANGKIAVAVWENDEHYIIEEQSIPIGIFPTHWMPLPEPPK